MKPRGSARPSNINTQTRTHSRKSVDDDFAPSVTPSSAETDFPKFYPYYLPKDPTWWPKQHPVNSPEPANPNFKLHKYKPIADPNYRPRPSTGGSSADEIRAATAKLKMKTRSGASTETQVHDAKQRDHKAKRRARKRSNPLKSAIKFDTGTVVRPTTRKHRVHGKFMTTDQLQRSPVSPKTAPYIIKGRNGTTEVVLTKEDIKELKKQAQNRRLSSLVFEKKHGHRRALQKGVEEPLASPKTATQHRWAKQTAAKRRSSAGGDEEAGSGSRSGSVGKPQSTPSASSGFSQYAKPRNRSLSQPSALSVAPSSPHRAHQAQPQTNTASPPLKKMTSPPKKPARNHHSRSRSNLGQPPPTPPPPRGFTPRTPSRKRRTIVHVPPNAHPEFR